MSPRSYRHLVPVCLVLACTSEAPGVDEPVRGTTTTGEDPPDEPQPAPTSSSDAPASTSSSDPSTTSTGSSGSDETTAAAGVCGDAVVDEGEACDLGADNRDDGACTLDCEPATCGDGLVHAGVEECDDAADNGLHYGGCGFTCARNPYCGDATVDVPYEQCDLGALNGTGEGEGMQAPCSLGCTWDGRVAFVTSAVYGGNLGGLDGADDLCRDHAFYAGFLRWNTFRAWLSDGAVGPLQRFTHIPARPILLPNGELVADSLSDLILHGPGDGVRVDEYGAPLPPSLVWTNVGASGEAASDGDHCIGWGTASPAQSAVAGLTHLPHEPEDPWNEWLTEKHWTHKLFRFCSDFARLYCFEQ